MSRFKQRRFNQYSQSGTFTHKEPPINGLSFSAGQASVLADLNAAGWWRTNGGATGFDQAFNTAHVLDAKGNLEINPGVANYAFGEYFAAGTAAYYTAFNCAERILRSDILIEYRLQAGIAGAISGFSIVGFNPRVGVAAVYTYNVLNSAVPTHTLTEATAGLGVPAGAFTDEWDAMSNKILISAQRVNANSKNLVVTWWARAGAATVTVTQNNAVGGCGDIPLMWSIRTINAACRLQIKSIYTSSSALSYGNAPI